jgi:hypothetical protein
MIREGDLPIYDSRGLPIHVGDTIMQGMRVGDPDGWDEVVVVRARESDEILGEDAQTGEREELAGDARLRGLLHCPHEPKP